MKVYLYIAHEADNDHTARQLASTLHEKMEEDTQLVSHPNIVRYRPDLIHILGGYTRQAARLQHKAVRLGIPTLYSPMGSFMPWYTPNKPQRKQQRLVTDAAALHVRSSMERKCMETAGWNERITYIPDASQTQTINTEEMVRQMGKLYQKIIDTHAATVMTESVRATLYSLLSIGLDPQLLHDDELTEESRSRMQELTPYDWRLLLLYAKDQRIDEEIHLGLERIRLTPPDIDITHIERFPLPYTCAEGNLKVVTSGGMAEAICQAINTLKQEEELRQAPLCHYADLYRMLRYSDYDEQQLHILLAKQKLDNYARQLMDQLAKITGLSEGYIPMGLGTT